MPKKTIGGKEALDDFRSGMEDSELMEKYGLSSKGLESLFDKLLKAGLIEQWELERRYSPLSQGTAIIDHGFPVQETKPQDKIQPEEQKTHPRKTSTAKINVNEAVSLILSGVGDSALMEKYNLSSKGLESLFRKLRQGGFVSQEELDQRLDNLEATVDLRTVVEELGLGQPTSIVDPVEIQSFEDLGEKNKKKPEQKRPNTKSTLKQRQNIYYEEKSDWYDNSYLVIVLVFLFFPVGLYGLYKNSPLSRTTKILVTTVWAVLVASCILLEPMILGDAEDFVDEINNKHGAYAHAELRGIFKTTLRLYWTNKTTDQSKEKILNLVGKSKDKLLNWGVKRIETPNESGTFTATNLVTGEEQKIPERSVRWFVQ